MVLMATASLGVMGRAEVSLGEDIAFSREVQAARQAKKHTLKQAQGVTNAPNRLSLGGPPPSVNAPTTGQSGGFVL
jgi:hypothetical protein